MPAIIPIPAFADNYIWLLRHDAKAAVVDPGDAAPVIEHLEREGIELCAIVNTHHHGDHVGGNHGRDLPDCVAILAGASRVEERILTMCGTSGAICPTARPVGRSFARVRTHSDHDHSGRNLPDRAAILARFVHAISIPTFA